jgi:hypothetical protein
MKTEKLFGLVLALLLGCLRPCVTADLSAREILDKSQKTLMNELFISRTDTSDQSASLLLDGRKIDQPIMKSETKIDIDWENDLVRFSGQQNGQEIVMIKHGKRTVMKFGDAPWQVPYGPYEAMAKDLGNLFVCERDVPELKGNAVKWVIIGTESINGIEAIVIESEGNSAVAIAEARMNKAFKKNISATGSTESPSAKVLAYSSKMWIAKSSYRPLQTIQTPKYRMAMPLKDGKEHTIDISGKNTSKYSYVKVMIHVPEEAKKILFHE